MIQSLAMPDFATFDAFPVNECKSEPAGLNVVDGSKSTTEVQKKRPPFLIWGHSTLLPWQLPASPREVVFLSWDLRGGGCLRIKTSLPTWASGRCVAVHVRPRAESHSELSPERKTHTGCHPAPRHQKTQSNIRVSGSLLHLPPVIYIYFLKNGCQPPLPFIHQPSPPAATRISRRRAGGFWVHIHICMILPTAAHRGLFFTGNLNQAIIPVGSHVTPMCRGSGPNWATPSALLLCVFAGARGRRSHNGKYYDNIKISCSTFRTSGRKTHGWKGHSPLSATHDSRNHQPWAWRCSSRNIRTWPAQTALKDAVKNWPLQRIRGPHSPNAYCCCMAVCTSKWSDMSLVWQVPDVLSVKSEDSREMAALWRSLASEKVILTVTYGHGRDRREQWQSGTAYFLL